MTINHIAQGRPRENLTHKIAAIGGGGRQIVAVRGLPGGPMAGEYRGIDDTGRHSVALAIGGMWRGDAAQIIGGAP